MLITAGKSGKNLLGHNHLRSNPNFSLNNLDSFIHLNNNLSQGIPLKYLIFRACGQIDTHETCDYSFGMVYQTLAQLDDATLDKETVKCKVIEYTKSDYGIIGVDGMDKLGTGRRVVIGKQNLHNKSGIPRTPKTDDLRYRGKLHSDLLSVMVILCDEVTFTLSEGHIVIKKSQVKPKMRPLTDALIDFQYLNLCVDSYGADVFEHAAVKIQDMIIQISYLLRGFVNRHPDFSLAPYEKEQCFNTTRDEFLQKHFLRVCDCSCPCQVKDTILTIYGCLIEVVRTCRRGLIPTMTLQDLISRRNCLDFICRFCTNVTLEKFRVNSSVPRFVERSIERPGMNIHVFGDDLVTKDELLTPKPKTRYVPRPTNEESVLHFDSEDNISSESEPERTDYDIPTTMSFRPR